VRSQLTSTSTATPRFSHLEREREREERERRERERERRERPEHTRTHTHTRTEPQVGETRVEVVGGEGLITKSGDVTVLSDGGGTLKVQAMLKGGDVLGVETFGHKFMIPGIFCLLPAFSILATATICRNVYVALFTGLFVGGALATGYVVGTASPPAA
jgi:hypothetical protein